MIINDKYKVESDTNNIILLEKHTITGTGKGRKSTKEVGTEYWQPIGYYGDIKALLSGIVRREIRCSGFNDLETLDKKIDELYTLINNIKVLPETLR
jgi:hypothetical protein